MPPATDFRLVHVVQLATTSWNPPTPHPPVKHLSIGVTTSLAKRSRTHSRRRLPPANGRSLPTTPHLYTSHPILHHIRCPWHLPPPVTPFSASPTPSRRSGDDRVVPRPSPPSWRVPRRRAAGQAQKSTETSISTTISRQTGGAASPATRRESAKRGGPASRDRRRITLTCRQADLAQLRRRSSALR